MLEHNFCGKILFGLVDEYQAAAAPISGTPPPQIPLLPKSGARSQIIPLASAFQLMWFMVSR